MSRSRTKQEGSALSVVLVKLLQGFLLQDDKQAWETLQLQQTFVREYFTTLGLYLHMDENDGYAFLRTIPMGQHENGKITGESAIGNVQQEELAEKKKLTLMRKMPLSFEVSLLCVLLREALDQFDATVHDDHRLIITKSDVYDLLKLYFPDKHDETKLIKRWDSSINKVIELGFIRELKSDTSRIEVLRIIKAIIDAERVGDMKRTMQAYVQQKAERMNQ
ncbi:MAG: DUF4194 domain-containing protein [Legionellaceae bacterium]|nr:DUF4194 domain-containing protein [Legionellaceae bacterium]